MGRIKDELTPKQKYFCDRYVIHRNATKAYQEAYECTYNTAKVEGYRNLEKPSVKEYLKNKFAEIEEQYKLTLDDCLGVLARIVKSNPMDYITVNEDGGAEIDLSTLTRDQAEAIQSITTETTYSKKGDKIITNKINFYSKDAAAINYGKHLGGFKTKVEHSATNDLSVLIRQARNRSKKNDKSN